MALRFFWRCESTSLTAGVDYSIGDTSATAAGTNSASISLHADAAKLGTSGVWCDGSLQYYQFDTSSTLIGQTAEGAVGFWIRFPDSVPGGGYDYGATFIGASASDYIKVQTASSGNMRISLSQNGGSIATISTTGANMQADTWDFVVARWDHANTRARVEVYSGTDTTPLGTGESAAVSAANSQAMAIALSTGFRVGNASSQTLDCHIDNVFVSDDYDEPLHLYGNRDITDVDSFTYTTTTKYLKLLAHADAQSKTGVAGVVFAAPSGSAT